MHKKYHEEFKILDILEHPVPVPGKINQKKVPVPGKKVREGIAIKGNLRINTLYEMDTIC